MIAILSDVHANLEALQAVLEDISRFEVERILYLGDTLGYGPDPIPCLALLHARCSLALMGDCDRAALTNHLDVWSPSAARSVLFARTQLEQTENAALRAFLSDCQPTCREGATLYVHGSAFGPIHEYVYPEDIYNDEKMQRNFALVPHVCYCGHTHLPGVITDSGWHFERKTHTRGRVAESVYEWHQPEGVEWEYMLDGRLTLVIVGSVGQPRDADPRACYVLADGERLQFRRVAYDVETTIRKIHECCELDNIQGDRLREGR